MNRSLLVATVMVVAGVVGLELGVSTAITEVTAGILLTLVLGRAVSARWRRWRPAPILEEAPMIEGSPR